MPMEIILVYVQCYALKNCHKPFGQGLWPRPKSTFFFSWGSHKLSFCLLRRSCSEEALIAILWLSSSTTQWPKRGQNKIKNRRKGVFCHFSPFSTFAHPNMVVFCIVLPQKHFTRSQHIIINYIWSNVKWHEMSNDMKCQMTWNVKWHEMSNDMKCQMTWNIKCHMTHDTLFGSSGHNFTSFKKLFTQHFYSH